MNSQLIPTVSGCLDGQTQPLVNARDLHDFLGVETKFRDWIKRRIADYEFTQDIDFCEISNLSNRGFWQVETVDYLLSLDMAKELAMVERNDKGRQARRYFIEMEKQARQGLMSVRANRLPHDVLWRIDALEDEFYKANPELLKLSVYYHKGLSYKEIGKLLDISASTVGRYLKRLARLGLIDYQPKPERVALSQKGGLALSMKRAFQAAQQSLSLEG